MCADAGGNTEMGGGGGGGEAGVTTRTRPRGERRGGMTRGGARNRGGSRSGSRNGGTERGGRNSGGGRTEKGKETDKRKENQKEKEKGGRMEKHRKGEKEKEVSGSTSTSTSKSTSTSISTSRSGTCETAWIKGTSDRCLNTLAGCSNRWGWTNKVDQGATERMEIWAGAGQCDTNKGTLVGYADVSYVNDRVKVTVSELTAPWVMTNSQLWTGEGTLPFRNNKYVAAPGSFPDKQVETADYDVHHTTAYVHVALHIDVCNRSGATSTSTSVTMEKEGGEKTHRRGKGKGDKDKSYSHNKGGDKSKNKSKSKEKEGCKKTQTPGGSPPPSPPGGNTDSPSGTPPTPPTPPTPTGGNTDSPAGTPPTPPSPPTPPTPTGGNTDSPSGTPPTPPTPTGGNTDSPSGTPPPTPPTPTGGNTDSPSGTPPTPPTPTGGNTDSPAGTPPTPPTPTGGETTEPCVDGGEPVEVEVVSPEGAVDSFGAGEPVVQGMHPHGEPSTTLANFPPAFVQANMEAFFPVDIAGVIGADNVLRVACPFNCEEKPCEVFVTTYHCPPCSTPTNGGLVSLLPGAGWEAGSCAPTFQQGVGTGAEGAGGVEHPTVAFRKLVSAGAVEELPALTAPLANVAVFVRQGATACGGFADLAACTAMPECAWEAGVSGEGAAGMCVSSWCPADFAPPASAASCATTCAGAGAVTPGGEGGETGTGGAGGEGGEGGEAGTGGFGPF